MKISGEREPRIVGSFQNGIIQDETAPLRGPRARDFIPSSFCFFLFFAPLLFFFTLLTSSDYLPIHPRQNSICPLLPPRAPFLHLCSSLPPFFVHSFYADRCVGSSSLFCFFFTRFAPHRNFSEVAAPSPRVTPVMFLVSDGDGGVIEEVDYTKIARLAGISMGNESEVVSELCKEQVGYHLDAK